jgi:hypothetical protein
MIGKLTMSAAVHIDGTVIGIAVAACDRAGSS